MALKSKLQTWAYLASIVFIFAALAIESSQAAIICRKAQVTDQLLQFPVEMQKLAYREQKMNGEITNPSEIQNVVYVSVDPSTAVIRTAGDVDPHILRGIFDEAGKIRWPRHPRQKSVQHVPHSSEPTDGTIPALYSASRSMFFHNEDAAYSIKMPLDVQQFDKSQLQKSVIISLMRAKAIRQIDAQIGQDPGLITLVDVLSVADKESGNGFVVRDLRALQDGHDTYPGFAMEKPFRAWAEKTGQSLDEVIFNHFTIPYAHSMAKMLLRYGLSLVYPHDQNYLVRFDGKTGKPLDQIVWRDLSDTRHVKNLFDVLGMDEIKKQTEDGQFLVETDVVLKHHWNSKFLTFPRIGDVQQIKQRIETEFARYVFEVLGKKYRTVDLNANSVSQFLLSAEGQAALQKYHESLRAKFRNKGKPVGFFFEEPSRFRRAA